jgi:hypothetical protein
VSGLKQSAGARPTSYAASTEHRSNRLAIYFTKLRYEASASISFGPSLLATSGIGESTPEWYPWPHCSGRTVKYK